MSSTRDKYSPEAYKRRCETNRLRSARRRKAHPDENRDCIIRCKYGISLIQKRDLYTAQLEKCAICEKPVSLRAIHIDHDHKPKKIRGLLCTRCNPGIGMFRDNPVLLRAAARYLETFGGALVPNIVDPREA